ncbi:hypothetical protein HN587_05810 [Candidatus Woesearchaeota archaeon]|jgi:hypothetical protein|nr:hypothetical protein [Candidatus Woesearchaeota archaeon]
MKSYSQSLSAAQKKIQVADHMLTQTYPMVKDPKLLLAVLENIFVSTSYSLDALLFFMRDQKEIPQFQESFDSKYNSFKLHLAKKHNFSTEEINLILDLKKFVKFHKDSPVEFSRNNKFVICSDKYEMKEISLSEMKQYIKKANAFLKKIENIIIKHES